MERDHSEGAQPAVRRQRKTIRRVGRTVLFGVVKGVATAVGGAMVTVIAWWIDHQ